jgi:site-specific DNA recombinase
MAAYCRVSTQMQVDRGESLDVQEQRLRAAADARGWDIVVFREEGISAKDANRPAYRAMRTAVETGAVDGVMATKLDRLWRNLALAVAEVDGITRVCRRDLIVLDQPLDTTTAAGRVILNVLLSFGQFERELTVERVREGMQARARAGKFNGGPIPYGYRRADRGVLAIDEAKAAVVREMFDLLLTRGSVRQVVHALNTAGRRTRAGKHWATPTIQRMLRSPTYVGRLIYNKRDASTGTAKPRPRAEHVEVAGAVPAIVSEDTFAAAQELLRKRATLAPRSQGARYLLSGLVRCGLCGGKMYGQDTTGRARGGSFRYYRCWQHTQKGPAACSGLSVRSDDLDAVIVQSLFDLRVDAEQLRQLAAEQSVRLREEVVPLRAEIGRLEGLVRTLEQREGRVMEAYEDGAYSATDMAARRAAIVAERGQVERLLDDARSRVAEADGEAVDVDLVVRVLETGFDVFEHLDFEGRRELVRAVVSEIAVGRTGGTFELRIPHEQGFEALPPELGGTAPGRREFRLREGPDGPVEWMNVNGMRVPRRIGNHVYRLAGEAVDHPRLTEDDKPAEQGGSAVYDRAHTDTGSSPRSV